MMYINPMEKKQKSASEKREGFIINITVRINGFGLELPPMDILDLTWTFEYNVLWFISIISIDTYLRAYKGVGPRSTRKTVDIVHIPMYVNI